MNFFSCVKILVFFFLGDCYLLGDDLGWLWLVFFCWIFLIILLKTHSVVFFFLGIILWLFFGLGNNLLSLLHSEIYWLLWMSFLFFFYFIFGTMTWMLCIYFVKNFGSNKKRGKLFWELLLLRIIDGFCLLLLYWKWKFLWIKFT